jgi:hypothetical protein
MAGDMSRRRAAGPEVVRLRTEAARGTLRMTPQVPHVNETGHVLFVNGIQRVFHVDGVRWLVREIRAPTFDRRGGTHLMFETDQSVHRIRDFPEDWTSLDDAALASLGNCIVS